MSKQRCDEITLCIIRGLEKTRVRFHQRHATGAEIRQRAGAGESDGLYRCIEGQVTEVLDADCVELSDGLCITIVPCGRVS